MNIPPPTDPWDRDYHYKEQRRRTRMDQAQADRWTQAMDAERKRWENEYGKPKTSSIPKRVTKSDVLIFLLFLGTILIGVGFLVYQFLPDQKSDESRLSDLRLHSWKVSKLDMNWMSTVAHLPDADQEQIRGQLQAAIDADYEIILCMYGQRNSAGFPVGESGDAWFWYQSGPGNLTEIIRETPVSACPENFELVVKQ